MGCTGDWGGSEGAREGGREVRVEIIGSHQVGNCNRVDASNTQICVNTRTQRKCVWGVAFIAL